MIISVDTVTAIEGCRVRELGSFIFYNMIYFFLRLKVIEAFASIFKQEVYIILFINNYNYNYTLFQS